MTEKMPSLRKKVSSFIRQLSVANQQRENILSETRSPRNSADSQNGCFIQRYLSGQDVRRMAPTILHGRNPHELPPKALGEPASGPDSVIAALTGPDGGLTTVNRKQRHITTSDPDVDFIDILDHGDNEKPPEEATTTSETSSSFVKAEEVAGIRDWSLPHRRAYGAATTLYELHPLTHENAGNPIADCFAIVARKDSAVMALADGVNWGQKACVAARSAVHGCVEYLNKAIFSDAAPSKPTSTTEVFVALFRSFHAAHSLILQEEGMLTTLTAALVLPLAVPGKYVACVCNVGDSLAYVYNAHHGVREITQGSHDIHLMRDMRDALGALGPVAGSNPELNNLTCSMTEVQEGDIVFLTSDGISDNFDPVVGKFAVLPPEDDKNDSNAHRNTGAGSSKHAHRHSNFRPRTSSAGNSSKGHARSTLAVNSDGLPTVQAYQRHELTLLRMEDLLKLGVSGQGPPIQDARELCDLVLDFATRITAAKRHILEDPDLYCSVGENNSLQELSKMEQRARRRKVCDKLAMVPGKLDHATVVAYQVGICSSGGTRVAALQETGL